MPTASFADDALPALPDRREANLTDMVRPLAAGEHGFEVALAADLLENARGRLAESGVR